MKKQSRKQSGARRKKAPRSSGQRQAQPSVAAHRETPRPRFWHHLWAPAAIVLAFIGALWVVGNLYGSPIAIGNRLITGNISDQRLEQTIADEAATYRLTLKYPSGQTLSFSLPDVGVYPNILASAKAVRQAQQGPLHRLAWWRPARAQLVVRTDNTALQAFIAGKATLVTSQPVDAQIAIQNGKVAITPGKDGRQYGLTNAAGTILAAARSLHTAALPLEAVPRKPDVSVQSLTATKMQLQDILGQKIHVVIGDETITPTAANIGSWLTLTPQGNEVEVGISRDALHGYLNTIADEHTADARSQVISDTTGAVLVEGANGVSVDAASAVTDEVTGRILQAKNATLGLPVETTAFKTVYAPTAGKWIEVDTSTKRMYAYDGGTLVRTFLVSAGAYGTPTVTGRYSIYAKYRSQDMFGRNADGSSYFQPDVPYVNYFYRDYAIHGNYWRPASYFGYINSSHGCVGVQVGEGAWIYSWAPVGTPVIVHT